jgi:hypothetical protein
VVLEMPAASEKGMLYGRVADACQVTVADTGPRGLDEGNGESTSVFPHQGLGGYLAVQDGPQHPVLWRWPSDVQVINFTTT